MEKYDPLDDLPVQFRRHSASPTPSHFSIITNTPSPEANTRNQQVMSPSPQAALRMQTTPQASTQQMTAEAAATATQALQMHVESDAGTMTLRSLTSFTLQPEHLQELQESILLDQSALQEVRSAIVELSARIQHRTSVLGSMIQGVGVTTQGLQEGCIALETHVAQLASAVQEQQRFMEQLREQSADSSETARVQLDQLRQEVTATLEQQGQGMQGNRRDLDQTIQRTAAIEARVETLAGQLEEIASMSRTMLVVQQEHKTRLDTQGQVLYSPTTGGNAEELTLVVQRLANKVDSELEFLRSEAATASDTHRETRANIMNLDNTMGVVSERLATVEKYVEDRELTSGDATSSGPQIFEMTPGKSPSFGGGSPLTAWWHEGENDAEAHRSEWSSKRAEDDHPWGLSVPPPGLPSEFTNKDTSADDLCLPSW